MSGVKSFTNNMVAPLNILLYVRAGNTPGRIRRCVGFDLDPSETKIVTYGSDTDPFLDGIAAYLNSGGQTSSTKMCVTIIGSPADVLLNTNSKVFFDLSGSSIVITATN